MCIRDSPNIALIDQAQTLEREQSIEHINHVAFIGNQEDVYKRQPLKRKISPHKLRATFGTNLYHETGDIYLVADVLGHADVNTTRRHYAAMSDDRRRMAARSVVLREPSAPESAPKADAPHPAEDEE